MAVPNVTPHALPETTPTVAVPGALLVQSPPGVALVRGVHAPTHTLGAPDIAEGKGFTVTVAVE